MRFRVIFLSVGLGLAALPASAATLSFNGLVADTCTLTLSGAGTMTSTPTGDELSSTAPGGSPARALLLTTSARYRMVIDPPAGFATAPANAAADAIRTDYTATGVTVVGRANGTVPLDLGLGLTQVEVNTTASRAAVFPSGAYRTDVVMRCEPR